MPLEQAWERARPGHSDPGKRLLRALSVKRDAQERSRSRSPARAAMLAAVDREIDEFHEHESMSEIEK